MSELRTCWYVFHRSCCSVFRHSFHTLIHSPFYPSVLRMFALSDQFTVQFRVTFLGYSLGLLLLAFGIITFDLRGFAAAAAWFAYFDVLQTQIIIDTQIRFPDPFY